MPFFLPKKKKKDRYIANYLPFPPLMPPSNKFMNSLQIMGGRLLPNQQWYAKWKHSWKICTLQTRFYARLAPICKLSRCLLTTFLHWSSVVSLLRVRRWLGAACATTYHQGHHHPSTKPRSLSPPALASRVIIASYFTSQHRRERFYVTKGEEKRRRMFGI